MSGTPPACATSASAARSATLPFGLPIVSTNTARVFSRSAARTPSTSPPGTNVVSIPMRLSVTENCVTVPP